MKLMIPLPENISITSPPGPFPCSLWCFPCKPAFVLALRIDHYRIFVSHPDRSPLINAFFSLSSFPLSFVSNPSYASTSRAEFLRGKGDVLRGTVFFLLLQDGPSRAPTASPLPSARLHDKSPLYHSTTLLCLLSSSISLSTLRLADHLPSPSLKRRLHPRRRVLKP